MRAFFAFASMLTTVCVIADRTTSASRRRTREQMTDSIVDRNERRQQKLQRILEERERDLADHNSGRRFLSTEDHERVTSQVDNFRRKLDQILSMTDADREEMVEREIGMMERRRTRMREVGRRGADL